MAGVQFLIVDDVAVLARDALVGILWLLALPARGVASYAQEPELPVQRLVTGVVIKAPKLPSCVVEFLVFQQLEPGGALFYALPINVLSEDEIVQLQVPESR